jgi:alkylhydroperoxidase/carboxymuconolactone decarboxylase family protein YurZ
MTMDVSELYDRGLKLRRKLFGNKAVAERMNGALNNGCTPEEVREILLLVALYCGIPAANEAHRIAYETINERLAGKA